MILCCTPYAPIPNRDALLALMPPQRRTRLTGGPADTGPLFAYALLALAATRHFSIDTAATLRYTTGGKPYLAGSPLHLSLSHSKTHALCALAEQPIGCDIETHRPISRAITARILSGTENPADFFTHWTLKESYVKLTDDASPHFSALTFTITDNTAQGQGTHGHLYRQVPNCTAALLAHAPWERVPLTILEPGAIFSYAAEKWA